MDTDTDRDTWTWTRADHVAEVLHQQWRTKDVHVHVSLSVLSHLTLCPIWPFLLSTLCLSGVFSFQHFLLFDILSIRRFVVRRFFTFGVFYFNILSVNR
jgi:hypothetical protein